MEHDNHNSIKDQVLSKIEEGQTKMKPKWHFALHTALFIVGVVVVLLLALYIASFSLFILDESDLWFVPSFGFAGLCLFLKSLPWFLIAIVLVFLILLHILVRHYAFAYQRPLLYSALAIIIFVIGGSLVIHYIGLHEGISAYSQKHQLPFAHPLYEKLGHPKNKQVYPGIIIEIREQDFSLQNRWHEVYEVYITTSTHFPYGARFMIGDEVIVIGEEIEDDKIEAFGIRKIDRRGKPRMIRSDMYPTRPVFIDFD